MPKNLIRANGCQQREGCFLWLVPLFVKAIWDVFGCFLYRRHQDGHLVYSAALCQTFSREKRAGLFAKGLDRTLAGL